jgi:hypothetical protein
MVRDGEWPSGRGLRWLEGGGGEGWAWPCERACTVSPTLQGCVCACAGARACACAPLRVSVRVCARGCVCTCVRVVACARVCACVRVCVCACVRVGVRVRVGSGVSLVLGRMCAVRPPRQRVVRTPQ